jgi:poly-gamma-glutamate synthesis protein (capsule biosynthesis protein)
MILSIILACQPDSTVRALPVEEPIQPVVRYEPPPMPKEGVVSNALKPMRTCLDSLPSCVCVDAEFNQCYPQFVSEVKQLPHLMQEAMTGVTWEEGCPIPLEDLRLVRVLHWTESDQVQWGEIVVTERVANDVQQLFKGLYQQRFPVHSLKPAHQYNGSDEDSMADNNTSAFNCRKVRGTSNWSEHSYGESIDINPLWNPWVKGAKVLPRNAERFVNREMVIPGMINEGDASIDVFTQNGWMWGSQKKGIKDYQHFSRLDHKEIYAP